MVWHPPEDWVEGVGDQRAAVLIREVDVQPRVALDVSQRRMTRCGEALGGCRAQGRHVRGTTRHVNLTIARQT